MKFQVLYKSNTGNVLVTVYELSPKKVTSYDDNVQREALIYHNEEWKWVNLKSCTPFPK